MGRQKRFVPRHAPRTSISEIGAVVKRGKGLIKAALVYPNTYRAGMSSLGFQTVYRLINQLPKVACERVFLPDPKTAARGDRIPRSIESGLRLDRFDLIFFSISFENDFDHLVRLLGEAGIPLRSLDRNHIHPLVVAGGVACFLNPEPIAPFIDLFLLGEAECLITPFFDVCLDLPDKKDLLDAIEARVPGAYAPGRHQDGKPFQIKVQYLSKLDDITTHSAILTEGTAFKDTFLIEILKGCPHGCRFCSAGFIYRPPRAYSYKNLIRSMEAARGKSRKIGLVSSAVTDHPDLVALCDHATQAGFKLSFSSLRADRLNETITQAVSGSGVKTATIAPEAGSERMRRIINKNLDETDILSAVRQIVKSGIINLKLYFMVGLPFETDDDANAIGALTLKIKKVFLAESQKQKKIGTITLSINPFIPKPATPFQWAAMSGDAVLKHRVKLIRNALKTTANVRINVESLRKARIHALLSLADRNAADLIEAAAQKGWASVIKTNAAYCKTMIETEKDVLSALPWDFIDNGVKKDFLIQEWERAKAEKTSPACPMTDCTRCGRCR